MEGPRCQALNKARSMCANEHTGRLRCDKL
jgi:hypothetical protein